MSESGFDNAKEWSVSEISGALKRAVESRFGTVRVRGEISGWRGAHSSGHGYFALKDSGARLEAVAWRSTLSRLRHPPEEGMEVVAVGKLTIYPGSSRYQIVIESLEPAGAGALMALLEERKKKFAQEGLFDEARKRPIPSWPRSVGIVTSAAGAALRDILRRISDRCPACVIVWPVRVQGEGCAREIAEAIRGFDALGESLPDAQGGGFIPRPELLIAARGGGSIEDLWGFNEETVVRAAADCSIPLISAVGHETDWTLLDYVADARASTPTAAGAMAVPDHAQLSARCAQVEARLKSSMRRGLAEAAANLLAVERGLGSPDELMARPRQRLDSASERLAASLRLEIQKKRSGFAAADSRLHARILRRGIEERRRRALDFSARAHRASASSLVARRARLQAVAGDDLSGARNRRRIGEALARRRERIEQLRRLLSGLSHEGVLARGFALALDESGAVIDSVARLSPGLEFGLRLRDGEARAKALGVARKGKASR